MSTVHGHPDIEAYLDAVCARVRCREVHSEIRAELGAHIADLFDAHMASGISAQEALRQALAQMGDPDLVGRQLHQTHRPRTDWWLLGASGAFVLLGILAMYAVQLSGSLDSGLLVVKQLVWSVVGLAAGTALYFLHYRRWQKLAWSLYGAALLSILAVSMIRQDLLHIGANYVEMTPVLFVPALAGVFTDWDWNRPAALLKPAALLTVPVPVYLLAPSLSPALTYIIICAVLLLASKPKRWQLAVLSGMGASILGVLALYVLSKPYRLQRVLVWINPYRDPLGSGYQVVQSLQAIRSAGPWGQGLGTHLQTLPEPYAEFVFPYLVYTLGSLSGIAICLLAAFFLFRLIQLARRVKDRYGAHLAIGIAALFARRRPVGAARRPADVDADVLGAEARQHVPGQDHRAGGVEDHRHARGHLDHLLQPDGFAAQGVGGSQLHRVAGHHGHSGADAQEDAGQVRADGAEAGDQTGVLVQGDLRLLDGDPDAPSATAGATAAATVVAAGLPEASAPPAIRPQVRTLAPAATSDRTISTSRRSPPSTATRHPFQLKLTCDSLLERYVDRNNLRCP